MNAPGFTASASLYRSSEFNAAGFQGHPSFVSSSVQAAAKAIYVGGQFFCYGEVTGNGVVCEGGGTGGGPSEPLCRPQCGPCRDHEKICITRNCDTIERPC